MDFFEHLPCEVWCNAFTCGAAECHGCCQAICPMNVELGHQPPDRFVRVGNKIHREPQPFISSLRCEPSLGGETQK